MTGPIGDLVGLFVKEGKRRLLGLTTVFAVIAIGALVVTLIIPKRWDASALIVVESSNIIKPLMEGRAVTMGITDQTALITQTVTSKRILREIVAFGGLAPKRMSPADEQVMLDKLKARIKIETPRELSVKIAYHDTDPQRAALITNKIAEIYVREGLNLKEKESRDAFEFINDRVKEYAQRLGEDHKRLLAYYRGQNAPATAPETDAPTPVVVDQPARLKISSEELAELRVEEATLSTEVGHKPAAKASADTAQAEEQVRTYRARVLQLQGDLDRLLVTYTDEHPDVKRTKRDLAIASEELHHAEEARSDHDTAQANAATLDDDVARAARERLAAVQAKIAAATGIHRRVSTAVPRLRPVPADTSSLDPEMKGVGQDTTLSELLRRYEATRDVYQDLLKRRENARVSMDLDAEHRGLTMHVEEAADVPAIATGLRLLQMSLIGLLIAAVIPIAFLVALVRLDPRVRTAAQIERVARLPLLVSIPYASDHQAQPARSQGFYSVLMVAGVMVVYVSTFIVRLKLSS